MKNLIILFILCSSSFMLGQSYIGYATDNYSGVHGVTLNPGAIADSPVKLDINLVSFSGVIANDYIGLSLDNTTQLLDGLNFTDLMTMGSQQNEVLGNIEIMGPSFMFSLSEKHSLGISSRARVVNNFNNINGSFLESIVDGFPVDDFSFNQNNLDGTTHIWGEVGLSYGRVLFHDYDKHYVKGGVTLKYLMGGGVAQASSNSLAGAYTADNGQVNLNGDFSYLITFDENQDPADFLNNYTPGFGMDIGFVYEYRDDKSKAYSASNNPRATNKYRAKIGISVLDIGSINYSDIETTQYAVNGAVSAEEIENDFEEALQNNFTQISSTEDIKIALPTSLRINIDYRFTSKLYVNLDLNQTLVKKEDIYNNNRLNLITITPRYESRFFSAYIPISYSPLGATAIGAGIKLGGLIIGSGSILSNLTSENPQMANAYVAFKIPIKHRK